MTSRTDARGVRLDLRTPPERIVSLVPSTTETLAALGLSDRIVGVTRFCVHPQPWVRSVAKVGGTKDVDASRVAALEPDLIVGNCEENTREIFAALEPIAPLWAPLPRTVDEALVDLLDLGAICGAGGAARSWHDRILAARQAAHAASAARPRFTYAWMIWRRPWMAAGPDTFTASLLDELGGSNILDEGEARYPQLTPSQLAEAAPDRILLSSEPFPFKPRHAEELAEATGIPTSHIHLVDGELGTWHGVRLAHAFEQVERVIGTP